MWTLHRWKCNILSLRRGDKYIQIRGYYCSSFLTVFIYFNWDIFQCSRILSQIPNILLLLPVYTHKCLHNICIATDTNIFKHCHWSILPNEIPSCLNPKSGLRAYPWLFKEQTHTVKMERETQRTRRHSAQGDTDRCVMLLPFLWSYSVIISHRIEKYIRITTLEIWHGIWNQTTT